MIRSNVRSVVGRRLSLLIAASLGGAIGASILLVLHRDAPIGELAVVVAVPVLILYAMTRIVDRLNGSTHPQTPRNAEVVVVRGLVAVGIVIMLLLWGLAGLVWLSSAVYLGLGLGWAYSGAWKTGLILLGTGLFAFVVFSIARTLWRAWQIRHSVKRIGRL